MNVLDFYGEVCYSSLLAAGYCAIVTSGRIGFFLSTLFELLLFLLLGVLLVVDAICMASRYGFFGCRLKC